MKLRYTIAAALIICGGSQILHAKEKQNTLSESDRRTGWRMLFDGKTTKGWRNYKKEGISDGWVVKNGALSRAKKGAGDIITEEQFDSFELSLDFRISPEGNSGIMFHVTETEQRPWQTGPEIQINDNIKGHDPQKAGWLYQLYSPGNPAWMKNIEAKAGLDPDRELDACNPAGQWNNLYLKQTPNQSEVMINGVSYYKFQKGSDDWNKKVAASKFSKFANFGKPTKGHICLQDHNDFVSYRNIKVRNLPKEYDVPDPSDSTLALKPVLAFPDLKWDNWEAVDEDGKVTPLRPIVMTHANDQSGRMFIATQSGTIHVLPEGAKSKASIEYLDIRDRVHPWQKGNEEGLLGFAIHPDYKKNGKLYIYYTSVEGDVHTSVVSEFQVDAKNPNKAKPSSERVIWTLKQPFANHNGGAIQFGPDGYLYIAVGDGGSGNDPLDNGQNLGTLFGSLLRIDVNKKSDGKEYSIPADNPFVNTAGARPEIYAYGFRNIWGLAFDSKTGDLWAADVGQNQWEEINLVQAGKNYGWNRREGMHRFSNRDSAVASKAVNPIWEYGHQVGKSITGGLVYRGSAIPELQGKYIYADFVTGKIWALDYDVKNQKLIANHRIPSDKMPILNFGSDEAGEIYFAIETANGKGVYRFAKD
ncbi:MAG: PQQ-dependent sugar dehydrogenase [Planctomycetaceae bacterium]|nr:PQQ-dependent sugar dehydrogenase [Planctomycetaceae bacterium]